MPTQSTIWARTPKGKAVTIKPCLAGTRNNGGTIYLGELPVASWQEVGSGNNTLQQALLSADIYIDSNNLSLVTEQMNLKDLDK
jgi:hypothetical protein